MAKINSPIRQPTGPDVLTRRDWFKVMGAAALGTKVFAASTDELRLKAKKNLKLAIFSGVYSSLPVEEAAQRIKADGFSGALLDYSFADARFDPGSPDWQVAKKITRCFARHEIQIVGIFGYYNVVDPDPARRRIGEARMAVLMANWERLGCRLISTETGTFNPKSEWLDSPENATEKGYLQCRAAFEKLARSAEKSGAILSIEPYWRNIIDSAERAERLFREIPSPALKLVMDPCNYFRKEDLPRMQPILRDIFNRVGKEIVLAHAKDVKAAAEGIDLPASGQGVLDYPLYLQLLAQLDRQLYLVIEHLTREDVPRARDFVLGQFEKI